MKSTRLIFIPVSDLRIIWPFAKKYILAAAKQAGEMEEEGILTELFQCRLQLITILEGEDIVGALTGKVIGDTAWLVHMGGDYGKAKWLFPDFEEWAKALGAKQLRIQGRLGWLRQLKNQGFREKFVTLEKTL